MSVIKSVKERILEKVAEGRASREDLIESLTLDGANKRTVTRTIYLLEDAGKIDVDRVNDTLSLAAAGRSLAEEDRLRKDVIKYKDQATRYKKLYEENKRTAILQDVLEEAIAANCATFRPVAPVSMEMPQIHTVKEMACLHLGDWHVGEVVSQADTGGIGEYNVGILVERAQNLAETVVDLCHGKLQGYTLPALAVFMLGDFVSTNIHNIQSNTDVTSVDSLFIGANIIGQLILDLVQPPAGFPELHIFTVPGNHGRLTDNVQYKQQHANWDNLLYHMLRIMLQNQENVHFHISKSPFTVVRLNGWRWLLYHGGNIRSWSGIPYYGIVRAFHNIRSLLEQKELKGGQRSYAVNKLEEAEKKSNRRDYLLENNGSVQELEELDAFLLSCVEDFMDMLRQTGEIAFDDVAFAHFHSAAKMDMGSAWLFMNGSLIGPTDYCVGKMFRGCRPIHWLHGIHHNRGASWSYPVLLDAVPADMDMRYKTMLELEMDNMWMPQKGLAVNV